MSRLTQVLAASAALALAAAAAIGSAAPTAAAPIAGDDGMSLVLSPRVIESGDPEGFRLTVTDANTSGATFDSYVLSGVPAGSVVRDGAGTLTPISPDPLLYGLPAASATSGAIRLIPPAGFQGVLDQLAIERPVASINLITDFDNGTFDYDGTNSAPAAALPQLPAGSTPYEYKDHTVYTSPGAICGVFYYGPCDGQYSLVPTAAINGPQPHFNTFWADLRSIENPLTADSVATVCTPQWATTPSSYQTDSATAATTGKLLFVNGSATLPVPHDVITTTVSGLAANTRYVVTGYSANVSDFAAANPVQTALVVGRPGEAAQVVGTSRVSPAQPSCYNAQTAWQKTTGVFSTGTATQLTIGVRNYLPGGGGNDFAIDQLSLVPLASVRAAPVVVDDLTASLQVATTSNPASGEQVGPGQTIAYTVTAQNTGNAPLEAATITGTLTQLPGNAQFVPGSASSTLATGGDPASPGPAPTFGASAVTWVGDLEVGQTATIRFDVVLDADAPDGLDFVSSVIATATLDNDPEADIPVASNCAQGTEDGCGLSHPIAADAPGPGPTTEPPTQPSAGPSLTPTAEPTASGSPQIATAPLGTVLARTGSSPLSATATAVLLLVAGAGALLSARRRGAHG